jgi:hypothetical protein
MKKIKTFSSFNEAREVKTYPGVNVPQKTLHFLKKSLGNRLFSQFIGVPWFGGLSLGKETPMGKEILLTWKNKTIPLPFVYHMEEISDVNVSSGGGKVISQDSMEHKKIEKFETECLEAGWVNPGQPYYFVTPNSSYVYFSPANYIYQIFYVLLGNYRKREEKFNIFDHDYMSLPEMKQLIDLGAKVVSTPIEKKNGTLSIEHPNVHRPILLQTTGYIRYKGVSGYITTQPELAKPLSDVKDIVPKLIYVKHIIIRKSLRKAGLSVNEIKHALKIFSENPEGYFKISQEIVQKYPSAVLYLPKPAEGFNQDLVKGARLMGRMGLF